VRCAGTPADKKLGGWTSGALVFYGGGTYGHVAICADESGVIFSTDLPKKGKVRTAPTLCCRVFRLRRHRSAVLL
jgi:hypothetical protein